MIIVSSFHSAFQMLFIRRRSHCLVLGWALGTAICNKPDQAPSAFRETDSNLHPVTMKPLLWD